MDETTEKLIIDEKAVRINQQALRLMLVGNREEAIIQFHNAIELDNNFPEPYFHLGNIYIKEDNFKLASEMYEEAIKITKDNGNLFFNLGICKSNLGEINEAIKNYIKCLKIDPSNTKALKFLGNCYKDCKNFKDASKIYKKWSELEPDNPEPKVCRALLHIRNARFDIGWKMYEEGLKNNIREPLPGFYQEKHMLWDGKKFNGTLLVYGEQGSGDQILYGTLLPDLLKVHKKVFLKIDHRLHSLFKDNFPSLKIFRENDHICPNSYNKFIAIGSLNKYFRKHTNDFMNSEFKFFEFNKNIFHEFKEQLNNIKDLKIGFSWHTFAKKNGPKRCLNPKEVSEILSCNNNSFINLQYGDINQSVQEINQLSNNKLISINGLDLTYDLENLIPIIKKCDLIITIDNTLAHLASSLGKNVWVLLPYSADPRWMEDISFSLYYQNTTVLRQDKTGSWENVIKILKTALSEEKS